MARRKEERSGKILSIIAERQKIEVAELSALLDVSQVTVRKDLDELEQKGLIKREHGFAHINSVDNISGRLAYHYSEKQKIARKAAELIHDNDTVMIESGSCCALLARELADSGRNLTIVTNSAFIADDIRDAANIQIILLGGIYQHNSQCLVGPMIRDAAGNYNVRYFFIGTDGWSERTGFTNKDPMRTQAVRDMAHSAEEIVILTESTKFQSAGTIPMNVRNQPAMVITDSLLDQDTKKKLEENNITVITEL